jgi:hypothetical protein
MPIVDRLFGRAGKGPPELDLAGLLAHLSGAVARQGEGQADPALVRARLADRCRDAGVAPLLPDEFDRLAEGLDAEAWRRLALLVGTLDLDAVRAALPALVVARPLADLAAAAFTGLARDTPLLSMELLRQGPLRVEELARRFVAALGATVRGETAKVSRQRLERLDYGRLLAEAEHAREAAAARVERLRRLQEEREASRPRRGKW